MTRYSSFLTMDLGTPVFSNPTKITNPLFPISNLSQVVFVGFVGGVSFRSETTLLPGTQPIRLANGTVETLTSQYVASTSLASISGRAN